MVASEYRTAAHVINVAVPPKLSPTTYLRVAALHEARRPLLDRGPVRDPVTRAASDFGLWHLSRFAAQYRALFGEPPSATVARRQFSRLGDSP